MGTNCLRAWKTIKKKNIRQANKYLVAQYTNVLNSGYTKYEKETKISGLEVIMLLPVHVNIILLIILLLTKQTRLQKFPKRWYVRRAMRRINLNGKSRAFFLLRFQLAWQLKC